jgi:hypothetical protein
MNGLKNEENKSTAKFQMLKTFLCQIHNQTNFPVMIVMQQWSGKGLKTMF